VADKYNLYVLELEPIEYEHAEWYVGITTDVDRRIAEHRRGGNTSKWVCLSEVVDHHIIGKWPERTARKYEDELTGHLMDEFGHGSVRGGRYTDPLIKSAPPRDPDNPSIELAEALAEVGHNGLASVGESLLSNGYDGSSDERSGGDTASATPRIYRRETIKSDRPEILQLHVQGSTVDGEDDLQDDVEDILDDDVYALDLREAAYLVAMQHPDGVAEILQEWGYDLE